MKSTIILAGVGVFLALATIVFVAAFLTPAPEWTGSRWPRGDVGNLSTR